MNLKLSLHPNKLELKYPFTISRWTYTHTESLVVALSADGISGFGEATYNPYYPNTEIAYMAERLSKIEDLLAEIPLSKPELFWDKIHPHLSDCPFALCAIDQAYYDWYCRSKKMFLYEYWNLDIKNTPPNSYTLSIDEPEAMVKRMQETPWSIYKIKLGTERDLEIVEILRQYSTAPFWVDANGAWDAAEAIDKSKRLKQLGVTLIEQPLPADQWEEMEEVFNTSALPLIADESCKTLSDIQRCKNHFHGVNIKAMKCGGLTPAVRMIQEARTHRLNVMMGCMAESTVGISAIAHLSPLLDYADMDGQHFIKDDPFEGVWVSGGGFVFAEGFGTGVGSGE